MVSAMSERRAGCFPINALSTWVPYSICGPERLIIGGWARFGKATRLNSLLALSAVMIRPRASRAAGVSASIISLFLTRRARGPAVALPSIKNASATSSRSRARAGESRRSGTIDIMRRSISGVGSGASRTAPRRRAVRWRNAKRGDDRFSGSRLCQCAECRRDAGQRDGHLLRAFVLGGERKIHLLARLCFALQINSHFDGAVTEFRQAGLDRHGVGLTGVDGDTDRDGLNGIRRQLDDEGQFAIRAGTPDDDSRGNRRSVGLAVRLMMDEANLLARSFAGFRHKTIQRPRFECLGRNRAGRRRGALASHDHRQADKRQPEQDTRGGSAHRFYRPDFLSASNAGPYPSRGTISFMGGWPLVRAKAITIWVPLFNCFKTSSLI